MIKDSYSYNATVRTIVAVFGSLFDSIYTGKVISGKLQNVIRVPLAYGPRERFLVRLRTADNSNNSDVAIKLPRMSFEITSLTYDTTAKLNKNNIQTFSIPGDPTSRTIIRQTTPYIIGFQLNIISDNQDLALQIIEQILPRFAPEYTVSVKGMEGPGTKTDVPFTLNSVNLQDDYEGDFETGRRTIIYSLDFTAKIKFVGSITTTSKIIREINVNLKSGDPCDDIEDLSTDTIHLGLKHPLTDTKDNFTVITTYGFDE